MKLLFVNGSTLKFTAQTPEHGPLGGTESCAAWLTRHLALLGHDVTLMCELPLDTPPRVAGVRHVPLSDGDAVFFDAHEFDAVIALTAPGNAEVLKILAPNALHIAWLHLMGDQPSMELLAAAAPFIDCAVMVSTHQAQTLRFNGPAQVIGNAIAPAFENMFASAAELLAAKQNRAVYASIPDRGLEWLMEAFRTARIETTLDIYSGRSLYQSSDAELGWFYDMIEATPRARRFEPLAQTALAPAMKSAAFLTYPANVPETYCIVAQEAMAAGLKVVSTAMGALPETTMGYADLMPLNNLRGPQVPGLFAQRIEANVAEYLARPEEWAQERFAQVQAVNARATWRARAKEWETFLAPAIAWKKGA
jgi:glycosyltransferase involved in cell wall biosynthesis